MLYDIRASQQRLDGEEPLPAHPLVSIVPKM